MRGDDGTPVVIAAEFESFEQAYLAVLGHVDRQFQFTNAPRGNPSRECLNVSFQISDPLARVPYIPARKVNIVFNYAEALWFLWGRDDMKMISYYAPRMRAYSANGLTVDGSAYGTRMFRPSADTGRSQFDQALDLIRDDPATKRAVMVLFRPWESADPASPDVSCTIAFQLLLRADELHGVCYMRANDAMQGLVSDVFSFTLIQEFAARQLGVDVGTYGHHVGSMHIGDRDAERVRRVLAGVASFNRLPHRFEPRPMPLTTGRDLAVIARYERLLRSNERALVPADLDAIDLHPYWQQVLLLFELYRQITRTQTELVDAWVMQRLEPPHRWLVAHRWPGRTRPPLRPSEITS